MIGTTGLKAFEVKCIVGVYEQERSYPQPVLFDIELDYDFAKPAESDALTNAVDYDKVASAVRTMVQQRAFRLLETMAEETVSLLFKHMEHVRTIRLEIRKPQAVTDATCSLVRVERHR